MIRQDLCIMTDTELVGRRSEVRPIRMGSYVSVSLTIFKVTQLQSLAPRAFLVDIL